MHVLELQIWKKILKTHGIIFLTAVISWLIFYINVNYLCVLHILGFQEKDENHLLIFFIQLSLLRGSRRQLSFFIRNANGEMSM